MTAVAVAGARGKTGTAVVRAVRAAGIDAVPAPRPYDLPAVDAVYFIAPNLHPDEPGLVARALDAAHTAGARAFVYHSVAWPYCPAMPHHRDKADAELLVRASGLQWTILQPCAYLQNFAGAIDGTAADVDVPYDPDQLFGFIDLGDVAAIAATVLRQSLSVDGADRHRGATYELGGPEQMSVRQLALACGRHHGAPVDVRRTALSDWQAPDGLSPDAADRLRAMFAFYDAQGFAVGGAVTEMLLGRRARRLADLLAGRSPADVANCRGPVGQSSISRAAHGRQ